MLGYLRPEGKLILDTDASIHAVGAVLSQEQDGVERVLAYYSQTLKCAECQYCVTRKELLAMVKGIHQFHVYLYGHCFTVRTDHAALKWLLSFCYPEGQVARWLQQLQECDFEIQHRPGKSHSNADVLSRHPCLSQSCRHCDRMESKETFQLRISTVLEPCCMDGTESRLKTDTWNECWAVAPEAVELCFTVPEVSSICRVVCCSIRTGPRHWPATELVEPQ